MFGAVARVEEAALDGDEGVVVFARWGVLDKVEGKRGVDWMH